MIGFTVSEQIMGSHCKGYGFKASIQLKHNARRRPLGKPKKIWRCIQHDLEQLGVSEKVAGKTRVEKSHCTSNPTKEEEAVYSEKAE